MFLASDTRQNREKKVRRYFQSEPCLSLLLGAVNFEWTVCRAVLFLSRSPNVDLRARMAEFYSLEGYKDLWHQEVMSARQCSPLAVVVRNWQAVRKAFKARNVLVHGRNRYTRNMAKPHVEALCTGTNYVDEFCEALGYPLYKLMPKRLRRMS